MDPADQTLVEDLSRDADTSVIQEITVSGIPTFGLFLVSFEFDTLTLVLFFPLPLLPRFLGAIGWGRVLIRIFRLFPCGRAFPSRLSMRMMRR